jgi:DNA-3-methyladenine glycosylase II
MQTFYPGPAARGSGLRDGARRGSSSGMNLSFHAQADLETAVAALVAQDPRLAPVLAATGMPALRRRPPGFPGLAAIVTAQQVSTASAAAIWGRLAAFYDPFDAGRLARARPATLARLGLSQPKIKTLKSLASAVAGGFDLETLADQPADAAHTMLTGLHGIGPWTADIYLLFCLGHADAFPAGDLALQEAARLVFVLPARPTARDLGPLADAWRPWRGAAAHLLWAYYKLAKGREGVLRTATPPPPPRGAVPRSRIGVAKRRSPA